MRGNGKKTGWQHFEDNVLRIVIILYVTFAHIIMLFLWPSGIKIEYINDAPWPYKRLWGGILRGFDEQ